MTITIVAGARPNFVKIAPIIHSFENQTGNIDYRLVHTGQHYDERLSNSFFKDLRIPEPHANLGVGSGSQAEQTAAIMISFEKELLNNPSDYVLLVGDVNSTLACGIVAKKLGIKVIHVEAGLRSGDMTMPEEINRKVVDAISDLFFTTTEDAKNQLINEGIDESKIHFVGNVMIDSLIGNLNRLEKPDLFDELNLSETKYYVLTLHRPSNVDDENELHSFIEFLGEVTDGMKIVFPVHPRTKQKLNEGNLPSNIYLAQPVPYLEFIYLVKHSHGVLTDSGGIQEESTYLGIPCLTLRNTTERPETITVGSNELLGTDRDKIKEALERLRENKWKQGQVPDLWDGHTAERIVDCLLNN